MEYREMMAVKCISYGTITIKSLDLLLWTTYLWTKPSFRP